MWRARCGLGTQADTVEFEPALASGEKDEEDGELAGAEEVAVGLEAMEVVGAGGDAAPAGRDERAPRPGRVTNTAHSSLAGSGPEDLPLALPSGAVFVVFESLNRGGQRIKV